MKLFSRSLVLLGLAGTALFMAEMAEAQVRPVAPAPAAAAKGNPLRIRRMPKPGRASMVRTPEFQTSLGRSSRSRKPQEWALFELEYETAPEWIDSLDFAYSVMTRTKGADGKDAYSLFQLRATYIDIQKGEHASCVVLAPNTLARFGEPVAIAIEVSQDGTLLAAETEVADASLQKVKEWWKNPQIIDSPIVTRREGLLERSKTPFALINMDDYEVVK